MPADLNKTELETKTSDEDNRRLFMKKMVALFGATTAAAVLSGCSVPVAQQFAVQRPKAPQNGELFSEHELTVLYSLCETILPKTDTPSAVEAGCHEFVPHQLQHCHTKQQQQLLVNIESDGVSTDIEKGQFRFLKALIVFGYFTSEVGATQALNYQAVPGGFIGSIPANSDTKSWGSLAYY
jgi:hypothetical protein